MRMAMPRRESIIPKPGLDDFDESGDFCLLDCIPASSVMVAQYACWPHCHRSGNDLV